DQANPDVIRKPSTANDQVSAYIENSSVTAANDDVTVLAGYKKPSALPGSNVSLLSAGTVSLPVTPSEAMVAIAIGGANADGFSLGGSIDLNLMHGSADA